MSLLRSISALNYRGFGAALAFGMLTLASRAMAQQSNDTGTAAPVPAPSATTPPVAVPTADFRLEDWLGMIDLRVVSSLLILSLLGLFVRRFIRTPMAARMLKTLQDDVFTNWRLAVLGITGLVLSLASGYTTWDGMTSFTCPARTAGDPCVGPILLSLMITFGIQGVMLIAAWLIGESFAQGLRNPNRSRRGQEEETGWFVGTLTIFTAIFGAIALSLIILGWVGSYFGVSNQAANLLVAFLASNATLLLQLAVVFAALALIGFMISEREIVGPYLRGARIVLKNLPIWLMFLACMTTSVFFSYDSLFSTIFPPDERKRAADIRANNRVAGLVSDVDALIMRRRAESIDGMFRSPEWTDYNQRMDGLISLARGADDTIKASIAQALQRQQQERATLQTQAASARSQLADQNIRRDSLLADVSRLKGEIPPIAAEVERLKSEANQKDTEILAKRAEAEAESGGVGGTLRAGRGPEYAKRRKELGDLLKLLAIINDQRKQRELQLNTKRSELAAKESELAQIDGQIGNLNGIIESVEAQQGVLQGTSALVVTATGAEQPPAAGEAGGVAESRPAFDATGGLNSLEAALLSFRRAPESDTFAAIQSHCVALLKTFEAIPELKAKAAGTRCDPGPVAELAGIVFALNAGVARFETGCGKGENLPQTGGTDALLEYGARCIQDSGLAGTDTATFRSELNSIALNRDDKAHRFVVTWNAFLDGNRLAYLALGIALALDGLVFMSGLFGANAVRSPLTDLPHGKGLSAQQLEAEIDGALGANPFAAARTVLQYLQPIPRDAGFVAQIDCRELPRDAAETVRRVLSAATNIGGAEQVAGMDVYRVHGALLSYLSIVCKRQIQASGLQSQAGDIKRAVVSVDALRQREVEGEHIAIANKVRQLKPSLEAALLPDLYTHAGWVLESMRPTTRGNEYASELTFPRGPVKDPRLVVIAQALNAGAAFGAILRDTESESKSAEDRFLARPEFTQALGEIRRDSHDRAQLALIGRDGSPPNGGMRQIGVGPAREQRPPAMLDISASASPPLLRVGRAANDLDDPTQARSASDTRAFLVKLAGLLELDQRHLHVMEEIRDKGWAEAIQQQLAKLADQQPKPLGTALDHARRVAETDLKHARDMLIWGPRGLGLQGQKVDAEAVQEFAEAFEIIHKLEALYVHIRDDIESKVESLGNDGMTARDEIALERERSVRDAVRRFIDGPSPNFSELRSALADFLEPPVAAAADVPGNRTLN